MTVITGYSIQNKIYESPKSLVFRAVREADDLPVILKILKEEYPSPEEVIRYRQEYEITRSLEHVPGVVRVYGLEKYQNTLMMVLEDFGAESLRILSNTEKFPLPEFLGIAIKISDALGQIHRANIIHRDINPSNIVMNRKTGELKIIDFGISTSLSRENPDMKNPDMLEGTLAYLSPEQTGRMNRTVDFRTDFYSLGGTFYELLSGTLPFVTDDPMELVHCHIAGLCASPHEKDSAIPGVVSDLVMKLLSKTAEDRYQSAWGLKSDLSECLHQLESFGKISDFPIAQKDIPDRFQIPQKLYGRESEIRIILDAFDRVSQGVTEIILVSGYSGIGKTALVREIYKPVTRHRGYFISGKFDQIHKRPYSAVIQAFQELVRHLLTENEEKLRIWRENLLAAFGPNGQVMVEIIPELELIIGKQPEIPDVPPEQAQNRFHLVFRNFMRVFTKPEHPLVIFLDDLQWADSATLSLLKLLETEQGSHLLLIGAFRDNEVSESHPLMFTVNSLRKPGMLIHDISVQPLHISHITHFLSDALHCEPERAASLAGLVQDKTNGNPFFMNEFLKSLYLENLLSFDVEQGSWQWDLNQIQAKGITDNVVVLMSEKIQKLSTETQKILQIAACIGNRFDLEILSLICEKPQEQTSAGLHPAIAEGMIIENRMLKPEIRKTDADVQSRNFIFQVSDFQYRFSHDRIHQAAYSLIPEQERASIHYKIGKLLLKNSGQENLDKNIIEIVDQMNLGKGVIQQDSEKEELAKLNLAAGKKAKVSSAFEPAYRYFKAGMELLKDDSWKKQYNLTLALYEENAEAAYLNGEYEEMERIADVILKKARTVLDKVRIYEIRIVADTAQYKLLEALKTARIFLKLLGVKCPEKLGKTDILISLIKTRIVLFGGKTEELANLPYMTDTVKLAINNIMKNMGIPASYADPQFLAFMILFWIRMLVRYGNTAQAPMIYATYGLFLCKVTGDIDSGYRFGKLSLKLLERPDEGKLKAKVFYIANVFIIHWKEHVRVTLKPLQEAYQSAVESGDMEYAAISAMSYCRHLFWVGRRLAEVEHEMTAYIKFILQRKHETSLYMLQAYLQILFSLKGCSENPCFLIGESYDEEKMLPVHRHRNDRIALCAIYFYKLFLCYIFEEYYLALENAKTAKVDIYSVSGLLTAPLFYFYDSLTILALYLSASKSEQKKFLKEINSSQKKMKKWSYHAPMNFLHKYHLVEAEKMRVLGKDAKAADLYDEAIRGAKENEYINEEALANELAAKFYLGKGKTAIAKVYMQEARYCYLQWGAAAKVRHLDEKYRELLAANSAGKSQTLSTLSTSTSTTGGSGEQLDLSAVIKASRMISEEIILDKLLDRLMKTVIENAGAQKGALILCKNGELTVDAYITSDKSETVPRQPVPPGQFPEISAGIVHYTARTKENVVLADAATEGIFTSDAYVAAHKSKSLLCIPILRHGDLTGILYLENSSAKGAFTSDRVEVLKLIATQAAISIENARFYADLEDRVRQRTAQLHKANSALQESLEELRQTQSRLVQSEKMASLGELVAGIAHEINTPLGVITSNNDIVLRYLKKLTELEKEEGAGRFIGKIREKAEVSEKACTAILSIINSLRVFARLDEAEYQSVRVDSLIDDTLVMMKNRLKAGIKIVKEYQFKEPVLCYPSRLNQVFLNIINNAYQAMNGKGTIYISLTSSEKNVLISFRDTGPGIRQDKLPRIFDPGFTTKGVGVGTGLGLSICYRIIVENHKGRIRAENHPEGGAVISVEIPKSGDRDQNFSH